MAKYYVFEGSTGTGVIVTDDETGARLPKRPIGTWVPLKELNLEPGEKRIAGSTDELIAGVKQNGYYRWPHAEPPEDQPAEELPSGSSVSES